MLFPIFVLSFCLLWSSAFIAGRIAMDDFDPFTTLVLRFALSAAVLLPFCLGNGKGLFNRDYVRYGLLLGLLNNAVYLGLSFKALEYISPGWAVIVVSCSPFMTAALAAAFRMESLSPAKFMGIVIGFCGVLVLTGLTGIERYAVTGLVLAIAGTLSFSLGTVLFRGKAEKLPLPQLNFWQFVSGAVFLLPLSLLFGRVPAMPGYPAIFAILHLVLISVVGMAMWFMLIRLRGAATAASYHLLNPVFGVLLSWLVIGTDLSLRDLAGALTIGLGLLVSTRGDRLLGLLKLNECGLRPR